MAFKHIGKCNSFFPERVTVRTKRHSPGLVCNITGATKMLLLQTSLSACALPFDGFCTSVPVH